MSVDPKIQAVTLGNAFVAIDCEDLGCLARVSFRVGQDVVDLGCDWGTGILGTLKGAPSGDIMIDAKNLDADRLKWVYDADVVTKVADESVTCLKITNIEWDPDDAGTPTEWSTEINLHTTNVESVVFYTDAECAVPWASATTPLNVVTVDECTGIATLVTDDLAETDGTLYVSFDYGVDFAAGVKIINPAFPTFPTDHSVVIWHRNKTTGEYSVFVGWKAQVIVDATVDFGDFDSNTPITVPIHLRLLAVPEYHPEAPLFKIYDGVVDLPAFIETLAI